MRIAILGATSMLAADYAAASLEAGATNDLTLFARDPAAARAAQERRGVAAPPECRPLDRFDDDEWDAIVNFIGVGDPARAVAMGADILGVTRRWDDRALAYIRHRPQCRYLFLSSGAAFGTGATDPVTGETRSCFDLNGLAPSAYYGVSKFYAEVLHRAHADRTIIDVRVFNYISVFADLRHRFLVNEVISAIADGRSLGVDHREMWRDYIGQEDFARLIDACLNAPAGTNRAVDAYSRSPISKSELLGMFQAEFGLMYEVAGGGIDATGVKSFYYSADHGAASLGYEPEFGSIETLRKVATAILAR